MSKNIYTVSQINRYIKGMFDNDYALKNVHMKGEISNCKYHSSGHIYFTLKEGVKSAIACVMFASARNGLNFKLDNGQQIVASGSISSYERDGKYQFYVRTAELDGAGNLYEKYEQLKKELEQKGYFSIENKRPIPRYAKTIGIVTSNTGAAIQDMINISKRRNPYVQLVLYPAKVQGEGAAVTIAKGIKALDQKVDVIIVGRGGGSIEDLWAFNELIVAEAIYQCQTPIISAVGHETDVTISDFVADIRVPTPSAAAELAVFDVFLVERQLSDYQYKAMSLLKKKLERQRLLLSRYEAKLQKSSPNARIREQRIHLINLEEKIAILFKNKLNNRRQKLALYIERMNGLSPLSKLNQGYAYISDQQKQVVKSVKSVEIGDNLHIQVSDGKIIAEVIKKENA